MEATEQAGGTTRSWTEEQLRIFDRWFEKLQSLGTPPGAEGWDQLRQSTLQSWEDTVNNSLSTQEELSKIVSDALSAWAPRTDDSRQAEAVRQMQEAVRSWTDAQRQAWTGFFDVAKKVDTSALTDTWNKLMEAGQHSMKQAWDTQAQWFASFYPPREPTTTGA